MAGVDLSPVYLRLAIQRPNYSPLLRPLRSNTVARPEFFPQRSIQSALNSSLFNQGIPLYSRSREKAVRQLLLSTTPEP
jgi:hypothetical protein